ncbi:MAG: hypothetical protein O3B01_13810 [Planctomycetota bacterium]|nr:hypothetical protein [Planctomycetota bacterium]MDA1139644.1 hypothetical protein [Planctomycetota bacterium]
MEQNDAKITVRALILGAVFSGLFAWLTVYFENRQAIILTATQISVLPYVLLFLFVLFINPILTLLVRIPLPLFSLLRLARIFRPLSIAEILIVFVMGSVSSGVSTFGLASQFVPAVGNLFNEHWNDNQAKWDQYIQPYINEGFFLAVPGIQQASIEYSDALHAYEAVEKVLSAAKSLVTARELVARAKADLEKTKALEAEEVSKTAMLSKANRALRFAEGAAEKTNLSWEGLRGELNLETVLKDYPSLVARKRSELAARQEALDALEKEAFEKVKVLRRGLPHDMRAIPGIIPQPGDNWSVYFSRVNRLKHGSSALSPLTSAHTLLIEKGDAPQKQISSELTGLIEASVKLLQPINNLEAAQSTKETLEGEFEGLSKQLEGMNKSLKEVNQERRMADAKDFDALDARIKSLGGSVEILQQAYARKNLELERARKELEFTQRVVDAVTRLEEFKTNSGKTDDSCTAGADALEAIISDFSKFDATYRRFLVGDIKWGEWARPVMNWGLIIILTYIILMTFNVLIFRQWAHNEKLIYPLAELPEILCGHDEGQPGIPTVFKSGLFWVGAAIPAFFLGWNLFVQAGIIPGFESFDLQGRNSWRVFVDNGPLHALRNQRNTVFFTMIGLSFLIPTKISFSLWFFYILYMVQLQGMVWAGYGVDDSSFAKEWWYTMNFQSAEGGGAMLVFAALILYKCRGTILCFFQPAVIAALDKDEQTELKISSFLFLFGSMALIVFLWQAMGANLFYTIFFYAVVLVITIGLIRAVAEGGILGFQCWFGPFHIIRSVFGMDKAWTSSALYAPLMVYYSLLFLDIKTFIAPAMANSIKIRDDLRLSRARFHGAIFIGIGVAILVSVLSHLILAYSSGADGMQGWFYTGFPKGMFKKIVSIAKSQPTDNAGGAFWLAFGGCMMAGLLYLRQIYFWFPHPIGMIMLVNPIMGAYWFSIFLGWLAKRLVTKYGNKETYRTVRCMFVGLIVGELIIIVLAMVVSIWTGSHIAIDLNRN